MDLLVAAKGFLHRGAVAGEGVRVIWPWRGFTGSPKSLF